MNKAARARMKKERDILQKTEKKYARFKEELDYDSVVTMQHAVSLFNKVDDGVGWKRSVQEFKLDSLVTMYKRLQELKDLELPDPVSTKEVIIYERGKKRVITPIHVIDREIQKIFCDYCLVPVLSNSLIYDNGASLNGKGVLFSRKRLDKHLKFAIKEWGTDFNVLTFDFSDFFNSVPHKTCYEILCKYFDDYRIVDMCMQIIKSPLLSKIEKIKDPYKKKEMLAKLDNNELSGMCLGSQVSQIMALIIANDLDHLIKDTLGVKVYVRYMDDGAIFAKTKEELRDIYEQMKVVADKLGLKFNERKTVIRPIKKGFTFLKIKYNVSKTGKIIRRLCHSSIVRMRRKLKKLYCKYIRGEITVDAVYDSIQSWIAHARYASAYTSIKHMLELYCSLFGNYKINKLRSNRRKEEKKDVLQDIKYAEYRWNCAGRIVLSV